MNNPLSLTLAKLPAGLPPGPIITAAVLAKRQHYGQISDDILAEAKEKADALQAESERLLIQARYEADSLLNQARQEAQLLMERAREEAITEAIHWLCAEQELERQIADDINYRWRSLTAQILQEILGQCDQNTLLLHRIERQVSEKLLAGRITLFVEPALQEKAAEFWAEVPEITVRGDSSLQAGQALLDNGLLRIHLNNQDHQNHLLAQLSGVPARRQHA